MKRYCIYDVHLLDGLGGDFPSADVFVEGELVRDVRIPSGPVPFNWEVIPGEKRTLTPGLIDGHVHLLFDSSPQAPLAMLNKSREALIEEALPRARMTLQSGVTTIRELAGTPKMQIFSLRDALATESDVPRIYDCIVTLTAVGGFGEVVAMPVNRGNAASVTRSYAEKADLIKVLGDRYDSDSPDGFALHFDDETFSEICRAATEVGKPLTVHAKSHSTIRQCLAHGVHSIEHGVRAEDEDLKEMARQGVYLDATFWGLKWRADNQPGFGEFDRVKAFYPRARDAGVHLPLGSDSGAVFTPHTGTIGELDYMVQAGLSPSHALISATSLGAQRIGDESIGAVVKGRKADLILLNGNPLVDITVLRNGLRWVMKGGQIVQQVVN